MVFYVYREYENMKDATLVKISNLVSLKNNVTNIWILTYPTTKTPEDFIYV